MFDVAEATLPTVKKRLIRLPSTTDSELNQAAAKMGLKGGTLIRLILIRWVEEQARSA